MLGVFIHVIGDAINNIGVIVSAAAIWWGKSGGRFYADPAVSMGIALMIFATSIPLGELGYQSCGFPCCADVWLLVKNSGKILLESAPAGVDVEEVKRDLEEVSAFRRAHVHK